MNTTKITPLSILIAARTRIAEPSAWGQGPRADRENFDSCCAGEAIDECMAYRNEDDASARWAAFRVLAHAAGIDDKGTIGIVNWNDDNEYCVVIRAFDLAIATLRLR